MQQLSEAASTAAERYLVLNARLIDRLRYAHRFGGADAARVRDALLAYRNADGGFGRALEPDLRGAASQPQGLEVAFWILDEIDAFDDPAVPDACGWLAAHSTEEGGVPWVLPSVADSERAPWWQPQGDPAPAALNPTGPIAGLLHRHRIAHPWLDDATEFCWRAIAAIDDEVAPYDALCALAFLERVDDRDRAEAEFGRLADALRGAAAIDPDAPGHVHSPLDFAPVPEAMARRLFTGAEIDLHLDALIEAQAADGGWRPNFEAWTPLVAHEWRGHITYLRLKTLAAYGRLG